MSKRNKLYIISILLIGLSFIFYSFVSLHRQVDSLQQDLQNIHKSIESFGRELRDLKEQQKEPVQPQQAPAPKIQKLSYNLNDAWQVIVTAYDLSVQSCGKTPDNPGYGVTASGMCLAGHTWDSARAIAVDPDMIPLGSQVMLIFEDEYGSQFNGIYTAVDTGGDIDGNRIDLFIGDFNSYEPANEAYEFGVRSATVVIV